MPRLRLLLPPLVELRGRLLLLLQGVSVSLARRVQALGRCLRRATTCCGPPGPSALASKYASRVRSGGEGGGEQARRAVVFFCLPLTLLSDGDRSSRDCLENYGFVPQPAISSASAPATGAAAFAAISVPIGALADLVLQLQTEQGGAAGSGSQGPFCRNPARAALAAACCAGAGFAPGPAGPATRRSRQRSLEACLPPAAAAGGEEPTLELGAEEGGAEEYIAPPPPDAMRLLRLLSLDDADLGVDSSSSSSSSLLGERPISRACELRALRLLWAAVAAEVAAGAQQLLLSPFASTAAAAPDVSAASPPTGGWAALAAAAFPSWTLAEQAAAIRAALQADDDAAAAEAALPVAAQAGSGAVQGAGGGEDLPPWDGLLPHGATAPPQGGVAPRPGGSSVAAATAAGAGPAGPAGPLLSRAKRLCALQYRRGRLAALLRHLCYVAAMLAVAAGEPTPDWARALPRGCH